MPYLFYNFTIQPNTEYCFHVTAGAFRYLRSCQASDLWQQLEHLLSLKLQNYRIEKFGGKNWDQPVEHKKNANGKKISKVRLKLRSKER